MKSVLSRSLIAVLLFNLAACGTILYPERKGQVDGRIDIGVALLDALGLFLFFIPGVVAFAIDFSNGTIYLPSGQTVELSQDELKQIGSKDSLDMPSLEQVLQSKLAMTLPANTQLQQMHLGSREELENWMRMHHQPSLALRQE